MVSTVGLVAPQCLRVRILPVYLYGVYILPMLGWFSPCSMQSKHRVHECMCSSPTMTWHPIQSVLPLCLESLGFPLLSFPMTPQRDKQYGKWMDGHFQEFTQTYGYKHRNTMGNWNNNGYEITHRA